MYNRYFKASITEIQEIADEVSKEIKTKFNVNLSWYTVTQDLVKENYMFLAGGLLASIAFGGVVWYFFYPLKKVNKKGKKEEIIQANTQTQRKYLSKYMP
jgi:hypothetical protein